MTDYIMPCDTFARLASVVKTPGSNVTGWFDTIRIDHGIAVATNRVILVAEAIIGGNDIVHIKIDDALVEQCRREAPFDSKLTIIVNEPLKYAVAKTSLGYQSAGNLYFSSDEPRDEFDRWKSIALMTREKVAKPSGGMFWDMPQITALAAASPSGQLVFEEVINCTKASRRPTVVRDVTTNDWFALFMPWDDSRPEHSPAKLPSWMGA